MAALQLETLSANCRQYGIRLYDMENPERGIVHVMGPELGLTQPGMTIVCGDSHTSTHGAFGALAFGIGTSEVEHVLATQCLLLHRPKTFRVHFEGRPAPGVTAKDMILALIARIGVSGGTGHVFEYAGAAVRAMDMEGRMTVCNMSIEGGARAGLIAPDETTFHYLHGRRFAPQGKAWDDWLARWRALQSDDGARFDREVTVRVDELEPMITYGTNPGMGLPISGRVPDPAGERDPARRAALEKALAYMALRPGQALLGQKVDVVFLGSCTNSRLADLRQAATLMRGRRVAGGLRMLVVPGSEGVRRAGRGRRAGPYLQGGRGRVALRRLLHVPGHERRRTRAGPVRGQHQQSQLRGPPGPRREDVPGQPADGCGHGRARGHHRPEGDDVKLQRKVTGER
jgi:3-isopropylmalate/(R)-2-methylmalate dehydratase large subunit